MFFKVVSWKHKQNTWEFPTIGPVAIRFYFKFISCVIAHNTSRKTHTKSNPFSNDEYVAGMKFLF